MTRLRERLWSFAFTALMLLCAALFVLNILVLLRPGGQRISSASEFAGLLLSGGTGAYCATELIRSFRRRPLILSSVLAALVILAGLAASFFWTFGGLRMARRSADATIIPELALPASDLHVATPKPTPQ